MEGFTLGQYIPGNSLIHRLDPRTKLISSALIIWVVFFLTSPIHFAIFGGWVFFLYMLAGVTGSFGRVIKPGMFLILFTVIINMLFIPGDTIIWQLGFFAVSWEGIIQGITMGFRILFLILLSSLVTLTTSPLRMTDGLEMLFRPAKRIGLPAGELAMMINIALRFIPTFWEETERIMKAQVSRGADFDSRNIPRRIKYVTALLIPLFISAFRKADELAMAMESRGYVVGMERSSLYELEFSRRDYIALTVTITSVLIFIGYRFF